MDVLKTFIEFNNHLVTDNIPSEYFNLLVENNIFPYYRPFILLTDLKKVPQSPVYHPEGNVWNHTMFVVDNAAQRKGLSSDPRVLMWAALLHDLGKITNTKLRSGRITAYGHDIAGEKLARSFLKECTKDYRFIDGVCALVRWHMQVLYVQKHLPYADIKKMMQAADVKEIAIIALCDRLGRGNMSDEDKSKELEDIRHFLDKCGIYSQNHS